ncbi:MAG: putative RNA methyltransferase, partial [Hyphomicrobiaceae bacterium]
GLCCPICGAAMTEVEAALCCLAGHSFDRAREGYYNLLAVQHKASKDPGDSREMVAARRRVLDAGPYAPIATRTCEIIATMGECSTILDAGCGEGYYLDAVARANPAAACAGIDISKWAVRAAAKRKCQVFWAVASNRHLPFAAGSVDVILSMFGFPLWDAFAAVQPPNGCVLLVDPGPEHLIEMRTIIYPVVKAAEPPSLDAALRAGYHLADEQRLQFKAELSSATEIADLLTMTPHDHRAPLAGREALAKLNHLTVTGDVVFRVLRRG